MYMYRTVVIGDVGILQSTARDMMKQKENTDIAMTKRIAETRDAKDKLQDHLSKVGATSQCM